MKKNISLTLLAGLAACAPSPVVRNLAQDPLPAAIQTLPARGCVLHLPPPIDQRPEAQKNGATDRTITLLVPLPFLWFSATEGVERHDPKHLGGEQMSAQIKLGLEKAIQSSGLCLIAPDESRATHTLQVTIEHLYASNAYKSFFFASMGAASRSATDFFPAGHVALKFELESKLEKGEPLGFRLAAGRLFDPDVVGNDASYSAQGVTGSQIENNRTQQIVAALSDVYRRLPGALDRALAHEKSAVDPPQNKDTFLIARQLADYDSIELAVIEKQTGRVSKSEIVERPFPIVSAPNEWIVPPYQPAMLSPAGYQKLLDELGDRFDVRRTTNLSAAGFFGLKPEPPKPEIAAPAEEPPRKKNRPLKVIKSRGKKRSLAKAFVDGTGPN